MTTKISASLSKVREAKKQLDSIKYRLHTSALPYDEAKLLAEQPLKILNAYMEKRAKDFRLKHRVVHFMGFIR